MFRVLLAQAGPGGYPWHEPSTPPRPAVSVDLAALFQSETPPPVLFVFAHPDDELFCCGLLRRLLHAGAHLRLIWATSGETGGAADEREAELRCAMDCMGVSPSDASLLRLPCRGLVHSLDELTARLEEVAAGFSPAYVVSPAWEGGHPDHDALNLAVSRAASRWHAPPTLLEFPLYSRTGPFWSLGWRVGSFAPGGERGLPLRLTLEEARTRRCVARCHHSQRADMASFMAALELRRATGRGEVYRTIPADRDYSRPPHAGRLNYEGGFLAPKLMEFDEFQRASSKSADPACGQPKDSQD